VIGCFSLFSATENITGKYQCMPCGLDCDKAVYDESGKCSKCQMEMVQSSSITFSTVEAASVCSYLKSHPRTILLDVRTKEEFDGKAVSDIGTLKNAINIPINELKGRLGELEQYKKAEILVFCSHSHRSPQAAYLLGQNGFKDVVNMGGGMSELDGGECVR